jgi:hypothetical protein
MNPNNDTNIQPFSVGNNDLTLTIVLDDHQFEILWLLKDVSNNVVCSGGPYDQYPDRATVVETLCVPDGCYEFSFFNLNGNGICCEYGNGSYSLVENSTGTVLASGADFGYREDAPLCLPDIPCGLIENFPDNPLTHQGSGTSSTTLSYTSYGNYSSFTISGIAQTTSRARSPAISSGR